MRADEVVNAANKIDMPKGGDKIHPLLRALSFVEMLKQVFMPGNVMPSKTLRLFVIRFRKIEKRAGKAE